MCGIATISIGRKCRGRVPYPKLRRLVKELMVELAPRGLDASGIAIINDPEMAESRVFKKALRPQRFVTRPKFRQMLEEDIGPSTNFILLHARAATVGGTLSNFNNHPIITEPVIGIHNGTLRNDDLLFSEFEDCFSQEGDVDSEIIFRLYQHFTKMGFDPQQAMSLTSKQLEGAFTGALVDMRYPNRMVMFKNERSLCIIRIPHFDMVIAVSEARFYDNAARRLNITSKDTCQFVHDGTGMVVDLNTDRRITETVVDFDLPVGTVSYRRNYATWLQTGLA